MSQEAVNALPGAAQYLRGEKAQAAAPAKAQVQCSHILAKHTGSRRPSSWRQVSLETLSGLVAWQEGELGGHGRYDGAGMMEEVSSMLRFGATDRSPVT